MIIMAIVLLIAIVAFGPIVAALAGVIAGLGMIALEGIAIILRIFICCFYAVGALGWAVWWLFDPRGASMALQRSGLARQRL